MSAAAHRRRARNLRRAAAWAARDALFVGLTILFVWPIVWMALTSFQSSEKMFQLAAEWIPSVWHSENYPNALSRAPFATYFLNSCVLSATVTAGNLLFCTFAGYGLAKLRFPGDTIVLLAILSTLMLPLEVTLVPTFLVINHFGWINTYQGLAAPLMTDAFGVFLMRQAMIGVPTDYIDAARMDGAAEIRILLQIVLPQCWPAVAVLTIFSFRDSWDQFLWPLTAISSDAFKTLPLGLAQFGDDYGNPPSAQLAVSVLATIPVFLLFVILQRGIRQGFVLSGLK